MRSAARLASATIVAAALLGGRADATLPVGCAARPATGGPAERGAHRSEAHGGAPDASAATRRGSAAATALAAVTTGRTGNQPLELVESAPTETSLDHPDIPNAAAVWLSMVRQATRRLDLAQFYLSSASGSALEQVVGEIEAAAARGVAVRLLVEQSFYQRYPLTVDRLARVRGIEVRRIDLSRTAGGILHAKYFVVDERDAYLGSQNFDWRSLEHIQEIGVRIQEPRLVRCLLDVFALDWNLAAGEPPPTPDARSCGGAWPVETSFEGEPTAVTAALSPRGLLPDESLWDLPQLVQIIDGATRSIHVQLLTYRPAMRDGASFLELDAALRRAAARSVEVRMLLSDWSKRSGTIEPLQRLAEVEGIEVKLVTIPAWSGGFIPFARVIHAKYLVVDGGTSWVGTSNWEGDYFLRSRNVGIVVVGHRFAERLESVFQDGWISPYAERLDPRAHYDPPAIEAPRAPVRETRSMP